MFQLELGHVVLWLPCFVQVSVALLFTATVPLLNTIIVVFLWLSIISSDIVFEVEAYKYKAVAQLIKTYGFLNSQFYNRSANVATYSHWPGWCPLCFIDFPSLSMTKNFTQTYKIWWGRWEMWVYQGTKPWLVSLIASKSSQVISFWDGFPRPVATTVIILC